MTNPVNYILSRDNTLFDLVKSPTSIDELITDLADPEDGYIQLEPLSEMLFRGASTGLNSDQIRECLTLLFDRQLRKHSPLVIELTADDAYYYPTADELRAIPL